MYFITKHVYIDQYIINEVKLIINATVTTVQPDCLFS